MPLGADRDRGIAIVAALWASAILAVIVLSVLQLVRADARLGRGREDMAELNATVDAAINIAILTMLGPAGTQIPVNGAPFAVPFAGREVQVSVQDEAGKIDLNTTGAATLRQLLVSVGAGTEPARQLADGIVDWRDFKGGGRGRSSAAGPGLPLAPGAAYEPRNALFQSVEELQLVAGMTDELYRRIAPLVTVYSQTPWIDPTFSSVQVLTVFRTTDSNADAALRRIEEERLGLRPQAASPGVVLGHAFTITAELGGPASARVVRTAVVRLTGQPRAPLLVYRWS